MSEDLLSSEPDHASEAQATQKDERPAIVPGDPSPLDSLDPEDVIEWIENHPESGQLLLSTFSQYFSGPLPPPNLLKGYDDVVPGSATITFATASARFPGLALRCPPNSRPRPSAR